MYAHWKGIRVLNFHLKPVIQSGRSYVKDSGDFLKKIKKLGSLPENAILVTENVAGVYPSTSHKAGLQPLEGALQNRRHKQIAIDKLVKMAQYLLKISYLKFDNDVFQKMSGTAIGTNFAPPYACIFMNKIVTKFLRTKSLQPVVWFIYFDDIFYSLILIFNSRTSQVYKVLSF